MKADGKINTLAWILIAIQLGMLVFFAFNRLVDGDEGFYLSAAREVAKGRTLYTDFFYPQMPYLPYIFSIFAERGFTTLFMTRLASVVMALLTTLLFYSLLKRLVSDRRTVNIILAMYVFSGLIISWHSVAKTFAWSDFFLMGSFFCLAGFMRSPRLWLLMICGAMIALAVNVRLVLMPLVILFYLPIIMNSGRQWLKRSLAYFVPMLAATIPTILFLIGDTKRFMFDNLGFHFMRNPSVGFIDSLFQRMEVVGKLLINPQILILLIAVAGTYIYRRKNRLRFGDTNILSSIQGIAALTTLVIAVTYLLPNPVLQHYFVQAVPFALLASVEGLQAFVVRMRKSVFGIAGGKAPAVLTAIYILGIIPYFVIFVGAVRQFDGQNNLGNLKKVCASLNQNGVGDPILTEMPIISVLANKPTIDGVEFLGFEYPLPLAAEDMRYYRMILNEDLIKILDSRQASHFVVINETPEALVASTSDNYQLAGTYEKYRVYRRKT